MKTKQPRANEEELKTIVENHILHGALSESSWVSFYDTIQEYINTKVAARDQEIVKILESCKKHCPNCEGDPEEWAGDECNKEWNGAIDTAIDRFLKDYEKSE